MRHKSLAWIGIGVLALAAVVLALRNSAGTVGGMTNADFGSIATGTALLIVIGGTMLTSRSFRAGAAIRHAVIWLGALLLLITVYSFRFEFAYVTQRVFGELIPGAPIASTDARGRTVVTLRRDASGHFVTRGTIDGAGATFLVDTGASVLTLTDSTASAIGYDTDSLRYSVPVSTANGRTFVAPVSVEVLQIGPLTFRDLRAYVAPPGALDGNLLGVNVLDRLGSYTVRGDEMILTGRT
ncbi:retropepsin-like aspartic protease family protein [Microbaculum marinum]|uniref:TIGR02281 family clan AA aspartic protease n=1 Tax=Microbaculum marinum TaxID=1764581 RepID=A0AAW9RRH5_9HYPH